MPDRLPPMSNRGVAAAGSASSQPGARNARGKQRLGARAVDTNGAVQPDDGARNAILRVEVVVE
jgi:hypothetical protein